PRWRRALPGDDLAAARGGLRMTEIRALVVDDEPHARENVCALLRREPSWRVVGECATAAALDAALAIHAPEVVFLDIRLPGANGVALARVLRDRTPRPRVVFTTAYETYAVEAFDVEAIDYLLKPFDDQRFAQALRRVEHNLAARVTAPAASAYLQRLVIRSIGRVQFVDVAQID